MGVEETRPVISFFREAAPAVVASALFALLHHVSSERFISASMQFDYAIQDWYHSSPAVEFWHGAVWIFIGVAIALALGSTSQSIKIAVLRGLFFGFFAPFFGMLFLNLDAFTDASSFWWLVLALPISLTFGFAPAAAAAVLSAAGFGGKYFLEKKKTDSENII